MHGFRLTALFCAHARISPRGVVKVMIGILKRSAICIRRSALGNLLALAYQSYGEFFLWFHDFLMTNDHHRTTIETGDTTDVALSSAYARSPASSSNSSNAGERNPGYKDAVDGVPVAQSACTEIGEDFTCQFYAFFTQTSTSSSMLISSFSS